MDCEQTLTMTTPIEHLELVFRKGQLAIEARGIASSLRRGPIDRNPASAWVDLENSFGTAQLIVWSDGQASASFQDYAQAAQPLVEYIEDIRVGGIEREIERLVQLLSEQDPTSR